MSAALSAELERLREAQRRARERLARLEGKQEALLRDLRERQAAWEDARRRRELYEQTRILLQETGAYAREQARQQLAMLVTNALQYVFGPGLRFEVEVGEHGGKPVAEFYVVSEADGVPVVTRPQDARGGGVVDVVSLALRVALLQALKPPLPGPLILDEPAKHVSEDYIVPVVQFLQSVSDLFARQIIMVTHNTHLTESADAGYAVRLVNGRSHVVPLRQPVSTHIKT